jgi:signal peptidase II
MRKTTLAAAITVFVIAADLLSKSWALRELAGGRTIELLGGRLPLTLAFNLGAAFGIGIGADPRWIFVPLSVVAVGFLVVLVRQAEEGDHLRVVSASLVLGGALGNLYDRVRWSRGVVDFLGPVDLGFMLWPIFNLAAVAITTGAILLALSFWREDAASKRRAEQMEEASAGRASASSTARQSE